MAGGSVMTGPLAAFIVVGSIVLLAVALAWEARR